MILPNSPYKKELDFLKSVIKDAETYREKGKLNSESFKIWFANAKSVVSAFENPRLGSNPFSLYSLKEIEKINWSLRDSMEKE